VAAELDLRQRLIAQRVIPVLRLASAELTERAIEYLAAAGCKIFEVTMTTPDATRVIRRFAGRFPVGAGTVLDLDTAQRCIDAGAQFLVSPCLVPGMAIWGSVRFMDMEYRFDHVLDRKARERLAPRELFLEPGLVYVTD
jgi:2-keto-3-deoxy-6-phosphogluconate aldolase